MERVVMRFESANVIICQEVLADYECVDLSLCWLY